MKKFVLCSLVLSGCFRPIHTRIPNVHAVVMKDANAYILMIDDGAGALRPRKFYAEDVKIVPDVPAGVSIWAEYVDAPGEFRGEGDWLILHVRSMEDVLDMGGKNR